MDLRDVRFALSVVGKSESISTSVAAPGTTSDACSLKSVKNCRSRGISTDSSAYRSPAAIGRERALYARSAAAAVSLAMKYTEPPVARLVAAIALFTPH